MGRFYLDMEWTNGNFYLGDIFEIAIVSEDSGNEFHNYIKIHYKLPEYVKFLCSISEETLQNKDSFSKVFNGLLNFLEREQATSNTPAVIIAHGGLDHDFPMLLSNCMKHKCDYSTLHQYSFLDSMMLLKQKGYSKPALANLISKKVKSHSALADAKNLREICNEMKDLRILAEECFTCYTIEQYLAIKLPVGIHTLYKLARECKSYYYLELILMRFVKEKTSLNYKQLKKIAYWYFVDRYMFK